MEDEYDYLFKILLIGDFYTGKSLFFWKLNTFFKDPHLKDAYQLQNFSVVIIIQKSLIIKHDGLTILLEIYDPNGIERFGSLPSYSIRGINGFLVFYDITNKQSFINALEWMKKIHKSASSLSAWMLIGSKCDLPLRREVLFNEGKALAHMIDIPFVEISSIEGKNIESAISTIISSILTNIHIYN